MSPISTTKSLLGCWSAIAALTTGVALAAPQSFAVTGKFVPQNGILMTVGQDVDSINNYASSIGFTPAGVTNYVGIVNLDGLDTNADAGAGRNNIKELAGAYPNSALVVGVSMNGQVDAVASGTYNTNIDRLLNTLAGYNRPVFLRWAYEVDGPWNGHSTNGVIQSFRYVSTRIKQMGYQNKIAMVWQTMSYCPIDSNINQWYPGDEYVDWVGLSYFAPQDCGGREVNKTADFAVAHNKPLMINESTPQRYAIGELTYSADPARGTGRVNKSADQIWNEWFVNYFQFMKKYSGNIKAVTYIDANWNAQSRWASGNEGYWGDSRVEANATIKANWQNELTNHAISGHSFIYKTSVSLFSDLGFGSTNSSSSTSSISSSSTVTSSSSSSPPSVSSSSIGDDGCYWFHICNFPGAFGITTDGTVYHLDGGQTGNFVYLCVNGDCRTATKVGDRYQRAYSPVSVGTSYNIEFKIQDNATGQCLASATVQPGGAVASTDCYKGQVPVSSSSSSSSSISSSSSSAVVISSSSSSSSVVTSGGTMGVFGITTSGTVYHLDGGQTGNFVYLCLNDNCQTATNVDGRFEHNFGAVSAATVYKLEYKIQDNATGQCITSTNLKPGNALTKTDCYPDVVPFSSSSSSSVIVSSSSSSSSSSIKSSSSSSSSSSSIKSSSSSSVTPPSSSSSSSSVVPPSSSSSSSSSQDNCGTSSSSSSSLAGDNFEFGINSNGVAYHLNGGQSAAFVYFCIDGYGCQTPKLNAERNRYEYTFGLVAGVAYSIDYKIEGGPGGQCITNASLKLGQGVTDSPCYTPGSGSSSSSAPKPSVPPVASVVTQNGTSFLVGGDKTAKPGFTLYVFDKDNNDVSNCYGTCEQNWPPLMVSSPANLTPAGGVTGSFGVIERTNPNQCGPKLYQVTYNHRPLYYYKGDLKAGDTNGKGIGSVWWLAEAELIPQLSLVEHPAPALKSTINGLTPSNFGYAIDIEGRTLTWRPSDYNNHQAGLIEQFSPWGGDGYPRSAKDPNLQMYCSNNQIQFHKVEMPGTLGGPYKATVPAECYGKYYYFLRYRIYGTVNNQPEDNWVYTSLYYYDENNPNDRIDPRLRPTVTYHSSNWQRIGHPHSRDRVEEAILYDATPYNNTLVSGLERYATEFVDGPNEFQVTPHANGSILRIEAFEWGAGNCQGPQYVINANNPMGPGRFDYGQIISWEATFGSSQNNFPGGTAISSQVYNTMQNVTVGVGFTSATGDPRLNVGGQGSVRMVHSDGCNPVEKEEKNAKFAQQLTTVQSASMVNDFLLGHNQFHGLPEVSGARVGDTGFKGSKAIVDVNGITQKMADKGSCGDCHFRDGRSSFVVQTPKGPRLAPPTYGTGMLQWIEGANVHLTWDGSVATVDEQAKNALFNDLGLTPADIGQTNFDRVVTYTRTLHVPVREYKSYTDPEVEQGEVAFYNAGCESCHQATQKTRSDAPVELRNLYIRPYTDMKLWDVGTGGKFRTAPLWGIGQNITMLERNNKKTLFMHDGRATSLEAAISAHGNGSVTNLSATDKAKIVKFLKTL